MPSEFSLQDVSLILENCPSINGAESAEQLKVLADTFVVSPSLIQVLMSGTLKTRKYSTQQ